MLNIVSKSRIAHRAQSALSAFQRYSSETVLKSTYCNLKPSAVPTSVQLEETQPKNAAGSNAFPMLGEKNPIVTGRFMTIESADKSKNLAKTSAFLIEKTIQSYCGEVERVKKTRDGKILVLTKSAKSAKNLQKLETLGEDKVKVSEHPTLNKCCVVVVCHDVIGDDVSEIEKKLASQGVSEVKRIMKKVNGELAKTAALEITMNTPNVPSSLKIAHTRVPTRPYYPRPRRCYKCLKFGHISPTCEAIQLCWRCAEVNHGKDVICENPVKCINCDNGSLNK